MENQERIRANQAELTEALHRLQSNQDFCKFLELLEEMKALLAVACMSEDDERKSTDMKSQYRVLDRILSSKVFFEQAEYEKLA